MNSKLYLKAGKSEQVTLKSKIIKLPKNEDNNKIDNSVKTLNKKEKLLLLVPLLEETSLLKCFKR